MYKYRLEHSLSQLLVSSSGEAAKKSFLALVYLLYINIYIKYIMYYIYVCVCLCVCVGGVLTINSGVDISGLPSFASIRHRNIIIFDTRKTLYLNA